MLLDEGVPIALDGEEGDLTPFGVLDETADTSRFAFLVEMDHFVREKYEFRMLCIRYLASRGWRWFGEELYWRHGACIDEFLVSGDEAALNAIDEPDWYASGFMKEPTERHSKYVKASMQTEQWRFAHALRRSVPHARYFGFDVGAADSEYLALANAATTYAEMRPALDLRERLMHDRVAEVVKKYPNQKIALLGGGSHLMKDDEGVRPRRRPGSSASVGHYTTHELAGGSAHVLAIWLLQGSGETSNPYLGVPPVRVAPVAETINVAMEARWRSPHMVRVGDDAQDRQVTQLHQRVMTCRLGEQTDAIVFAPEVNPLRSG